MSELPWKEAIISVLSERSEPMHYADVADSIAKARSELGATPGSTVNLWTS